MTARPIVLIGHPILRTECDPVTAFDAELQALVADLTDTLYAAEGRAGVAASQIGVSARVFVFDAGGLAGHMVNPSIVVGEERQDGDEGCLSLPGLYFPTPRARSVTAHGYDRNGEPLTIEATGFLARALQHESDHLNGRLYVDGLTGDARRQALRAIRAAPWSSPAR
jgi:peptide deformylase